MRINNNLLAYNSHRQLGVKNKASQKSMERLSSGLRINRAGDDAAGLAISEKMRGQINGLRQASHQSLFCLNGLVAAHSLRLDDKRISISSLLNN